ncbi:MAG TPA: DUF1015 domain-containing protein [Gemmatimonadales bacterium]|nr:DUF1015 domain-containing protein [Gemmatimonadales bacterium]
MGPSDLVVPFRGERYRAADRLSRLIAPPYDVIAPPERARLAALDEHNIVHVMLPEAPVGDRYAHAAELLAAWRAAGALARDAEDAVYVMAQGKRVGVFAAVAAEGYEPRRVRPHEKTHAGPKADRLALLRATRTNIESIFLIAPDADGGLARALAGVAQAPPAAAAELDGVAIRLWVVSGQGATRLLAPASRLPLYMADGHHRYETASAYARENPAADRVLAFIVSARDPGLTILPTHRVIFGAGREPAALLERWRGWFDLADVPQGADPLGHLAILGRDRTACLVAWPDGSVTGLALRPDAPLDSVPGLGASPAVRALDVARVEILVVKAILSAGTSTPLLRYVADGADALAAVRGGGATAAVLLNPTRLEQVFAVADAADVMPPKSTYFFPKVPSGLVLRPL